MLNGSVEMTKMQTIRISQIKLPLAHTTEDVFKKAAKAAGIPLSKIRDPRIVRQSIDARKKDQISYVYTVDLMIPDGIRLNARGNVQFIEPVIYDPVCTGTVPLEHPVCVIGSGPAGLFCAYLLARSGFRPLIFERGKRVEERREDVEQFWKTGILDPASNVQFGEGGAGTFSDGKLNTAVKDRSGRNHFVLETFVRFGAPEDILFAAKPHIGTDLLIQVISSMRKEIESLGGRFFFSSQVTDLEITDTRLNGLLINGSDYIPAEAAVLAVGHSARDTFEMLRLHPVSMEQKAFAIGYRVEHPQEMINESQYGNNYEKSLPASPYKLTHQAGNGRGVYSFCMCPGGYVVNASSEPGGTAVNGMSLRDRDSACANSAIIMTIRPEDYDRSGDPLDGVMYQRDLESRCYSLASGAIPQQLLADYAADQPSTDYGGFESCARGRTAFANLRGLLPEELEAAFLEGMEAFGHKIKGFDRPDTILSGVESRTSCPLRILRGEDYESTVKGLYPCGEGAGYAGGITSAAMDGLKCAEAIMKKYRPA